MKGIEPLLARILVSLLLLRSVGAKEQYEYYGSCFRHLRESETNDDGVLSRNEFSNFIFLLSEGLITVEVGNSPPAGIMGPYLRREDSRSQSLSIAGIADDASANEKQETANFCQEMYDGLYDYLAIRTEDLFECNNARFASDTQPNDGNLSRDPEFVQFVLSLAPEGFGPTVPSFAGLPAAVREVFDDYADDETGVMRLIHDDQEMNTVFQPFCLRVQAGLALYLRNLPPTAAPTKAPEPTMPAPPAPNVAPTSTPPVVTPALPPVVPFEEAPDVPVSDPLPAAVPAEPTEAPRPAVDLAFINECVFKASEADEDQNGFLNKPEYFSFVNGLSGNAFKGLRYDGLPDGLRHIWEAEKRDINAFVSGIKKERHVDRLRRNCENIYYAINEAVSTKDDPTPSPLVTDAPPPTPLPVSSPPVEFFVSPGDMQMCKVSLIVADVNRDDLMDQEEYFRFVNRMANLRFNGGSYGALDEAFHATFDVLNGDKDFPDLAGSKPGQTPTDEQEKNLSFICTETLRTINNVLDLGSPGDDPSPALPPVNAPAPTGDDASGLSEEFLTKCLFSMVLADLNRDDMIDSTEYARFVARLLVGLDLTSDAQEKLFQETFDEVSSDGLIDVSGTKPGQTPTAEQSENINAVCTAMDSFIKEVRVPISAPAPGPTASPPAPADDDSWMSGSFFQTCKMALIVADIDRSGSIGQDDEFVRFINRLTSNAFQGATYDKLDPVFHSGFAEIAGFGTISIAGARPGSTATPSELENLQKVCTIMSEKITEYEDGPSPDEEPAPPPSDDGSGSPPAGDTSPPPPTANNVPTIAPTATHGPTKAPVGPPEMGNLKFQKCKSALVTFDTNGNERVDPEEFVSVLNKLSGDAFENYDFKDLPPTMISTFNKLKLNQDSIDVAGASPIATPRGYQMENLENVCSEIYDAIFWRENLSSSDQECIAAIRISDTDGNERLDQNEYAAFIRKLSPERFDGVIFTNFPYLLLENYEWLTAEEGDGILIAGVHKEAPPTHELIRLQWTCHRTNKILEAIGTTPTFSLLDHCKESMVASDTNEDYFLDQQEYASLVNLFTGIPRDGLTFDTLDPAIQAIFKAVDKSEGLISIDGAKSDDTLSEKQRQHLQQVCEELGEVIHQTRGKETFFQQCKLALRNADTDMNKLLSQSEYVHFLYSLANMESEGIRFEELDKALQVHYNMLKSKNAQVDIKGLSSKSTQEQASTIRWICENTAGVIESIDETTVTVYNSFIVSNHAELTAYDLIVGRERSGLEAAYEAFVKEQMTSSVGLRLRRRRLRVVGVAPTTIGLYQIDDSSCPNNIDKSRNCQIVFGSFDLIIIEESSPEKLSESFSEYTQKAVDDGYLQGKLSVLDEDSRLRVEKSSSPVQPILLTPAPQNEDDDTKEQGSINAAQIFIYVALTAIGLGIFAAIRWYLRRRSKRKEEKDKIRTTNEKMAEKIREEERRNSNAMFDNNQVPEMAPSKSISSLSSHSTGMTSLNRTTSAQSNESGVRRMSNGNFSASLHGIPTVSSSNRGLSTSLHVTPERSMSTGKLSRTVHESPTRKVSPSNLSSPSHRMMAKGMSRSHSHRTPPASVHSTIKSAGSTTSQSICTEADTFGDSFNMSCDSFFGDSAGSKNDDGFGQFEAGSCGFDLASGGTKELEWPQSGGEKARLSEETSREAPKQSSSNGVDKSDFEKRDAFDPFVFDYSKSQHDSMRKDESDHKESVVENDVSKDCPEKDAYDYSEAKETFGDTDNKNDGDVFPAEDLPPINEDKSMHVGILPEWDTGSRTGEDEEGSCVSGHDSEGLYSQEGSYSRGEGSYDSRRSGSYSKGSYTGSHLDDSYSGREGSSYSNSPGDERPYSDEEGSYSHRSESYHDGGSYTEDYTEERTDSHYTDEEGSCDSRSRRTGGSYYDDEDCSFTGTGRSYEDEQSSIYSESEAY